MAATTFNLENDFAAVAERLNDVVPHDRITVVLIDEDDPSQAEVFAVAGEVHPDFPVGTKVAEAESAIAWVTKSRKPVSFTKDNEEYAPPVVQLGLQGGYTETYGVPLFDGDNIVGMVMAATKNQRRYSELQKSLLVRMGDHLAVAVVNQRMRARVEAQSKEIELVGMIGKMASSSPDLETAFSSALKAIRQFVHFDRLVISNIDRETSSVVGSFELGEKLPGFIRFRHSIEVGNFKPFDEMLSSGKPIQIDHEQIDEAADSHEVFAALKSSGYRRLLFVPLVVVDGDAELAIAERITAQIAGPIAGAIVRQRDIELADEHSLRVAAEIETAVLAELIETKSNFIGAMSHELKTPLTSIVAFADILSRSKEQGLEGRPLQQIKVIQRNARHLEGMINELLDLSRMESGHFEILKSPFDFAGIVVEAIESSQPQLEAMTQTVDFQIAVDVLLVNGDRERLFQVMTNLLSNASKYSPNDSNIEIEVSEDQHWLTVEVRDRGPGVPDDDPEALFAMFGRADNEITRRVPGTGIGLHVSKRIVDEHGGQITIKSRDGGGAVARFRIPLGVNAIS